MSPRSFTLASRGSQLAQAQTNMTLAVLEELHPPSSETGPKFTKSWISNPGDRNQTQVLYTLNGTEGKAFWTKDLEVALLDRKADILVHAFKDVPTTLPEGCVIAGVLEREDPVDSFIAKAGTGWKGLEDLPEGSVVGTSSVRRIAQLKRNFPNLKFKDCRGNIDTRLAKLDAPESPYAAIILARAGMVRTGRADRLTSDLHPPILFHAVSQGAIGFEVRADDAESLALCEQITHKPTFLCCMAERAFLRVLQGGCSVPVGVATVLDEGGKFEMTGCVTALDGSEHIQHTIKETISTLEDAEKVGVRLANILIESGANKILEAVSKDREQR
ncbi:porphobilinogen deaminase, dipyromethane cofactor binding domain-containing protein [Mycena amicta]|nr:porphobilinogen deaminase, dipyromethane cofactor binding domain-containing protein [Mycena amicta]